jgi:hypothetical protein
MAGSTVHASAHQHLKPTWHQSGRTIGMAMGNQHGVDLSQSILWEPLDGGRLEVFANVDNNGPEKIRPFLIPH